MPAVTRREWLERTLILSAAAGCLDALGAQGLDRFMVPAAPCDAKPVLTPAVKAADFKPGAPLRRALADRDTAGTRLSLAGTVSGLTCGRITAARIDLWHADARGAIDTSGYRFRGHQVTDAEGRYAFDTIAPGALSGHAPRLNLRLEIPTKYLRKAAQSGTFMTALFFPADPRNAGDPLYRSELAMKAATGAGAGAYVFDVILDL